MRKTLVVTNDFPPRQGGIQSYVHELTRRQPPGSVVVYASDHEGSAAFDAAQPFPVVRHPGGLLVPTPASRRRITAVLREHDARAVWFGASAPLGLLAPALRDAGAERIVASTHGHEAGWAMLPGARQALRRIGEHCDVITYITEYVRRQLGDAFGAHPQLVQLTPGVDVDTFRPDVSGTEVRARYGLTDRLVVACVSRLVPRKGQDLLIEAWPSVLRAVPDAALLLVGSGPYEAQLRAAGRAPRSGSGVHRRRSVPAAARRTSPPGTCSPCRAAPAARGLDVEGLGIVYLEASATGLPVVAGDSGGAPGGRARGETGYVVGGRDVAALTDRLVRLLTDAELRRTMGAAGRAWTAERWRWDALAAQLTDLLQS